jgi:hypothetical protein
VSTASISLAEKSLLRSNVETVWAALVNATATWMNVEPALFRHLDWDKLISAAQYHGVLPIVAQRMLESAVAHGVEPAIKDRLRRAFQANLIHGLPLVEEVLRIAHTFESQGIAIIPYKGPVLAEHLWGNSALRECADLDFLLENKNLDRAGGILDRLGYTRVSPIADHLRPALLKNASEEQFQHRESRLLLELQWSPVPRVFAMRCNVDAIWSRAREISFSALSVLSPSAEDLLMLLSIHGWKHNWGRLIWLGDIAHLVRATQLDWDRLFSDSKRDRNVRLLSLAFRMTNRVFGVAVPQQFDFVDPALDALVNELERRMRDIDPCGYRDWHRCMLSARDSQVDRARQMATFLFTPGLGEYAACDLPQWADSGYRVVRVARLLHLGPRKRGE